MDDSPRISMFTEVMKNPRKIIRAIKQPKRIIRWVVWISKSTRNMVLVKIVKKDGKLFYKYKGELYPAYLKDGKGRLSYILQIAKKYCKGRGLDIGAGNNQFPNAIPIEDNPHQNAYKLDRFKDNSLDYIFSSHCLEHLDRWQEALALWIRKLRKRGILFLYLPHQSMKLSCRGSPWVENGHKWVPNTRIIINFLLKNNMKIVNYLKGKDRYWSFYIIAKKK